MNSELEIVRMRFGSHVYGTNIPGSDQDFKSVFVPSGRDLLLGTATKRSRSTSTGPPLSRNTADDIDVEEFALAGFLKLMAQGQTVTTDMLFVPPEHYSMRHVHWMRIVQNRDRLLSRRIGGFVGYCKSQANKYGIKGSRMSDARAIVELLETFERHIRMDEYSALLEEFCRERDHSEIVAINQPEGRPSLQHLSVCGRKISYTTKVKHALETYRLLFEQYGERTRQAESNEGVDWKALMHAVRIGDQAIELLSTGHITFPRPNAEFLVKIRTGQFPYQQIAELIENRLQEMDVASAASALPEKPDFKFIEELVLEIYERQIL